jgi:HEAT repeat protein
LKRHLDAYDGNQPSAIVNIMTSLDQVRDQRALPDLEALSGSRLNLIRSGAMGAIRRMAGPGTAPFLIQRLDYPDREVQYEAVITLAEIFKKGGEYGPDVPTFEKNPESYVAVWKRWWSEEGARLVQQ